MVEEEGITFRQGEVKNLKMQGMKNADVARIIGVSERTIKRDIRQIGPEMNAAAEKAITAQINLYNKYEKRREEFFDAVFKPKTDDDSFYRQLRAFTLLDAGLKSIEILRKITPKSSMERKTKVWGELLEITRKRQDELRERRETREREQRGGNERELQETA